MCATTVLISGDSELPSTAATFAPVTKMALEIERKFLVNGESWRAARTKSVNMRQAYFATTNKVSIRIRISDTRAFLNFKSTHSLAEREEFEYEVPTADGLRMLSSLCDKEQIVKTRHYIEHAGNTWMVDEFLELNQGLVVAEIELKNRTQTIEKPPWLGVEVTQIPRYYNHFLAQKPYISWSESERNIQAG